MTDLSTIKLFATHPHNCSYLPEEESTSVFVDPETRVDLSLYEMLSEYGFRRSGKHLYRPQCANCRACIPIRIEASEFVPNHSQWRCVKKNRDLIMEDSPSIDDDESYALYESYIEKRHFDGDMYPASRTQYREFLSNEWGATHYLKFRTRDGNLLAVAVSDQAQKSISAIYSFFDPRQTSRSLGVYCVLAQIFRARELGLAYVYLGYWIKSCRKMSYKVDFKPFQLMLNNTWVPVSWNDK